MEALRIFWAWWRDQLLDLVPGRAARRQSQADDGLILSDPLADGALIGSIIIGERRGGTDHSLGRFRLDRESIEAMRQGAARSRLPIVLRLPAILLLEREVSLPIAAERDLARVLFHEMDRYTPFAGNEVLWTYNVRMRNRAAGKLSVRLSLIHKAAVAALIETIAQAGLRLSAVELAGADGLNRRIPLDHLDDHARPSAGLLRPIVLACGGLAAIAAFLPFVLQSHAAAAVERQVAASAPAVARVQQLRQSVAATTTGADVIAAERRRAGDALEAIALLTDALPDDTYLTALTFDAGKLTLDGQSKSAAALIAPLTATRRLQDASFTAPVIRNTLGLDTFSMRLRVTR